MIMRSINEPPEKLKLITEHKALAFSSFFQHSAIITLYPGAIGTWRPRLQRFDFSDHTLSYEWEVSISWETLSKQPDAWEPFTEPPAPEPPKRPLPCAYCTAGRFKGWYQEKCPYCGRLKPKPITVATTSGFPSEVNDEDCINVAKWKDWAGETSFFHKTVRELMLAGF